MKLTNEFKTFKTACSYIITFICITLLVFLSNSLYPENSLIQNKWLYLIVILVELSILLKLVNQKIFNYYTTSDTIYIQYYSFYRYEVSKNNMFEFEKSKIKNIKVRKSLFGSLLILKYQDLANHEKTYKFSMPYHNSNEIKTFLESLK